MADRIAGLPFRDRTINTRLALLASGLILVASAVNTESAEAQSEVPSKSQAVNSSARPLTSQDIQERFAQLRERVLVKSPDVETAESSLRQKRSALYTSWTQWAPRVDLRLSQTTAKDFSFLASGNLGALAGSITPQETTLNAYSLDASMPLYRRPVHLGVERAAAESKLAQTNRDLRRSEVSWRLRQTFGRYLLQTYKLATVERSLKIARTNLQEAQLRFRLGQRTVVDVLRTQASLAQLEARQVNFAFEKSKALSDLLEYSGLGDADIEALGLKEFSGDEKDMAEAIERFARAATLLKQVEPYPTDIEKLGEMLAANSLMFKSFEQQREVEESQARLASAGNWPDLSLRGSLGKQGETWNDAFASGQRSYSYGVVLTIPLFSFGSSFSTTREANELIYQSDLKKAQLLKNLKGTLQTQRLQIQALGKSLESFRFSMEKGVEVERLTFKSYQLGKATLVELETAQNDLLEAKIQYAQAQVDLAVLIWQFKWNLGLVDES